MSKLEYSRGDVLASTYEVIDHLGDSPLGVTYRVKHLDSGKFVRLTVLRPEVSGPESKDDTLAAFRRAKDLRNPHLVRLGELSEHQGTAFVTWEDFDGRTLRELLQEYRIAGRKFGLKDAAQVVNQILEALCFLHDEGVILRALRPEYILVNVRYAGPRQRNFVAHVKLVGACLWDLVPSGTLVEDEYTRGEAQYMAPELKSFEPVATPRSDIYSAGVVFYEMLTGTAPVGTFLPPSQARPELPKLVDDVVELAMANSPEDRYRSARDLINGIQRVFEAAATEPQEEQRTWPLVLGIAGLGGLLVLLSIPIVYYLFVGTDEDKSARVEDQRIRLEIKEAHKMPTPAEREAVQSRHPKGMIYVPPGPYLSGRLLTDEFANKGAEHLHERVDLPGYLIDAFEHPNAKNAEPTTKVTWQVAQETCQAEGKRLCSAQEWEKACKGPLNFIYAYGDTYDPSFCGEGLDAEHVSGQHPECRSGWGVYDLSGGLKEWTATSPGDEARRVVKGGSLSSAEKGTRCAFSTDENTGYTHATLGFRCCRDVDAPPVEAAAAEPDTDAAPAGG